MKKAKGRKKAVRLSRNIAKIHKKILRKLIKKRENKHLVLGKSRQSRRIIRIVLIRGRFYRCLITLLE